MSRLCAGFAVRLNPQGNLVSVIFTVQGLTTGFLLAWHAGTHRTLIFLGMMPYIAQDYINVFIEGRPLPFAIDVKVSWLILHHRKAGPRSFLQSPQYTPRVPKGAVVSTSLHEKAVENGGIIVIQRIPFGDRICHETFVAP